jgi:RimJ/RimL family protein N-acetyltransferase
LSTSPYPSQWERHIVLGDGCRIFVRPLKPDDQGPIRDLLVHVSKQDLRLRFFDSVEEFSPQFVTRLTDLDYAHAMAFVAIDEISLESLGVVRLHADENLDTGDYAILLRSALKGRGLGWSLMQMIIEYAKREGLKSVKGQILHENTVMLKMCRELGFEVKTDTADHLPAWHQAWHLPSRHLHRSAHSRPYRRRASRWRGGDLMPVTTKRARDLLT